MAVKTKIKPTYKKKELPSLPKWEELLHQAVNEPGIVSECYKLFHDYSPGNQILAMWQCADRKIEPGPLGTFNFWKSIGRHVSSGPGSGIYLCFPFSWTKEEDRDGKTEVITHTYFKYAPKWFVLSQTEGEPYEFPPLPGFNMGNAIVKLEVEPVAFTMTDGNCMGYAADRTFAVNPLGKHQLATTLHELAHIVLGHTKGAALTDENSRLPRDIKELEAEATALIVLDQLDEKDHTESRGYIQTWYRGNDVPEDSARRIFSAAHRILSAGRIGQ